MIFCYISSDLQCGMLNGHTKWSKLDLKMKVNAATQIIVGCKLSSLRKQWVSKWGLTNEFACNIMCVLWEYLWDSKFSTKYVWAEKR